MDLGENTFLVRGTSEKGKFLFIDVQDGTGKKERLSVDKTGARIVKNGRELKEGSVISLTKLGEVISSVVVVRE